MTGIVVAILGVLIASGKEQPPPLASGGGAAAVVREALAEPPPPMPATAAPRPADAPRGQTKALPRERLDRIFGPWRKPKGTSLKGPQAPAKGAPLRRYRIKKNDVLSVIAQRELGSARRWREILKLNPGLDPKRLRPGMEILLPPRSRRKR